MKKMGVAFFMASIAFLAGAQDNKISTRMKAVEHLIPQELKWTDNNVLLIVRGVDLNKNSVKDSLENYLLEKYKNLSAEKEIIAFAASFQKNIEVDFDSRNEMINAYVASAVSSKCLGKKVGKEKFNEISTYIFHRTYETEVAKALFGAYVKSVQAVQVMKFNFDDAVCDSN